MQRTALTGQQLRDWLTTLDEATLAEPVVVWVYDRHGNEDERELTEVEATGGVSLVTR